MPINNHEKALVRSGSSLDLLAAGPIKKRHFLYASSPSSPCETPSPVLSDCGIPEEMRPAVVNVPKDISPDLADCMPGRKPELLMPASPFLQMNGEDSSTVTHDPPPTLAESVIPKVGSKQTIQGKVTAVEGITAKQEERGEQTIQSKHKDNEMKDGANYACLERSTWDLNTTMDAWEGSSADLSLTGTDFDGQDFGGKHDKGPLLDLKYILFTECSGSKQFGNNNESNKPDNNLKLANPCTSSLDSTSEASLDLGLKPSFLSNTCIISGKHEATKDVPFLSLGTKPMLPTSIPPLSIGRTAKSEPVAREIPMHTRKVHLGSPRSLNMKQVKSEPFEQQDIPYAVGDKNLTCIRAVKPEPLEHWKSGNTKSPKGTSYPMGQIGHSIAPQITQIHQKVCIMTSDTIASNDSSSMGTPIPGTNMSTGMPVIQGTCVVKTEPSAVMPSPTLNENDMNLLKETLLPKILTLNSAEADKHIPVEGASEFAVKIDSVNEHCLTTETLLDEIIRNPCQPCGNNKVLEANEVEGKAEVSSEILKGPSDTTCKSDNSPAGAMDTVSKQEDNNNVECENGGARNPASDVTNEGPCFSMPSFVDKKETKVESSEEGNTSGSKEHDGGLHTRVESCSSPVEAPNIVPGIQSLSKTIKKTLKNHQKNNKGSKKKIKTMNLCTRTSLLDSQSGVTSNSQQNADGPKITENYVSAKDANDRGNSGRIVYLNSASNSLPSGKKKFASERSIPYRRERERPFNRSFRMERSPTGGRREESRTESARQIDIEGHYGNRSRTDRPSPLHGDRNSTEVRDFRPSRRNGEFASGADGFRRPGRRLTNGEIDNLSRYPSRHHPIGDISPHRFNERDVPDFVLVSQGEKLMNMQAAGIHTSGGRSLSPSLRRGGRPQLLNEGLQSSSISQQHSTHHLDGFSEPREFVRQESIRHRSPPIRRINRMQLPQDMIPRRQRSPLYMGQVPNDMVDVSPFREDFPRPARGFTRNTRQRINDPRENSEEHYLGPEFHAGDEFVDDGRCVEKPVPIHYFRQQFNAGDRDRNHFHVEDDRGLGLRPVPEGCGPRSFEVRFRNRLGNSSGRMRGTVEDLDYCTQHEGQEWHHAALDDVRHKRRRF